MPDAQRCAADRRLTTRATVERLATPQAGVVSRSQLYAEGVTRGEVRAQVRARRWRRLGVHAIATHTGALDQDAKHWSAVIEGGPRAMLDGESALLVAGLRHYEVRKIRVTVPRGARVRHRGKGVDIRQTRRWRADEVDPDSTLRRSRTPVAAVRAALWARSDRQVALLVTMVVQQGLATAEALGVEMLRVKRDRRRALLHAVILDVLGGVGSLHELDVLTGCRQRGLPEPDLQVLRRTDRGSYYLDFRWSRFGVVLEVDGIQHSWAEQVVGDALRHNSIALSGDVVLRLPVLGLRVAPDEFFDQVGAALVSAGWTPHDRAA